MTIDIIYDSKTVNLLIGPDALALAYKIVRKQKRSGSGKYIETIVQFAGFEGELDCYFKEPAYENMVAWWSWAMQGQLFAIDATGLVTPGNTTLDGGAAAAQKVIPLTSTSGLSAGDKCLIRNTDRLVYEIVEIASVSAGVSVTAVANLKQTYASGDGFRHLVYFPYCVLFDEDEFNPEKSGEWYRYRLPFVEVVG